MSSASPPSSPSISSSPSIQSSHSISTTTSDAPTFPIHALPSTPSSPSIDSDVWGELDHEPIYHPADHQNPDYSSDVLDHRSSTFDSEADAQQDWDPESASQSQSQPSDSDSESSMSDEITAHEPLFEDPFSPDLADELELALLAEMDQLPHLREQRLPRAGNREGSMAGLRQGGAANRDSPADVLVDLELYFQQGQGRPERRSQNNHDNQNGNADVIDLTNEPDSPVQTHASRPAANPRRQNSQGRNPPSFARSDSSILAGNAPVIDLTDDSPEVPRRHAPVLPPPAPRHRERSRQPGAFGMYNSSNALSGLAAGIRRHLYPFRLFPGPEDEVQLLGILHNRINQGGDLNNPLGNIQLQYEHGAFDRAESPKPIHQAPPPAKSGFTRDTGTDLVVICPACNEELAYDPDVPMSESHPTRKGKRQRSEHHFWALKGCGHVYCEDCFENRKPAAKRPNTGFRRDPESKIICAVDGCETQATNKTGWVGIYL
ncbi:cell cycle control protein [Colletotrichum incanum]|uniref:Cell cycle control protein n=1 Tax=Colletotrichum incanum TaxID=1573173 RepID=A0A167D5N8_COLIC|nr:cell cycle control protein [Colletotrichum incanum]